MNKKTRKNDIKRTQQTPPSRRTPSSREQVPTRRTSFSRDIGPNRGSASNRSTSSNRGLTSGRNTSANRGAKSRRSTPPKRRRGFIGSYIDWIIRRRDPILEQGEGKANTKAVRSVRLRQRMLWPSLFMSASLILLVWRMGHYAIVEGEAFEREVYARMLSAEKEIPGLRGKIVDANHKVIANSELVYHIVLDPKSLLNEKIKEDTRTRTYTELGAYLEKDPSEIKRIADENRETHYKIIQKSISAEDMEMLKAKNIRGIWFEESFRRTYPKEELAAQVLGFYNGIRGQYGVEQQYDTYLQGTDGRIFPKVQDGNIVTTESVPAKEGNKVVLTIDEVVQQYVEQTMDEYVEKYEPLYAAALIMNPNTGDIYSMYTSPGFNPNTYTSLEEQMGKQAWESLTLEEKNQKLGEAWTNYNTQHPYEPGSTFKPMIIAAALEEGIITGDELYNCTGNNTVADRNIQCWKRSGHGVQTLEQALAHSCNTAVIEIAAKMPKEMFSDYMVRFGLGKPTGVDLPAEASGLIHKSDKLGPVEKATASMGQGFTLTPIQLMSAFASVINGGKLVQPHIVSQVIDENNQIVKEQEYTVKRQVISQKTSDIVRDYMQSVINYGTGTAAAIDGYVLGGKTGTAQKLPREDNTHIYSFVGYAPLDKPEIMALILFDEIEEETGVPTKAFADIMSKVLPYMGIQSVDTPHISSTDRVVTPSIEGLNLHQGIEHLYAEGLDYETIGVGTKITGQYPKEGTKLPQGSQVKIYLESDQLDKVHTVPDLIGLTIADAKRLTEGFFEIEGSSTGVIKEQIPKANTKIEVGNKIIVQTSQ